MYKKNIFVPIVIAFLSEIGVACSDIAPYGEEVATKSQMRVDLLNVNFSLNRSSSIHVDASNDLIWVATSDDDWLSLENTSMRGPGDVTINVKGDNPSSNPRYGNVKLTSQRYNQTVNVGVTQEGSYIKPNNSSLEFPANNGEYTVRVEANVEWTLTSKPSWLTIVPSSGNIGFTMVTMRSDANSTGEENVENIVFSAKNRSTTFTITAIRKAR